MIEYLSHSPSREVFVATMTALVNPATQEPLASVDPDTGELIPSEGVRIDEIGEIVKVPATYDENDNELTPAEMVGGHHANLVAYGALADVLAAGGGWDGIFPLLGAMNEVPPEDGVPAGWQGSSGMRIYPAENVTNRVRVWA
jgi:hypothetical protein